MQPPDNYFNTFDRSNLLCIKWASNLLGSGLYCEWVMVRNDILLHFVYCSSRCSNHIWCSESDLYLQLCDRFESFWISFYRLHTDYDSHISTGNKIWDVHDCNEESMHSGLYQQHCTSYSGCQSNLLRWSWLVQIQCARLGHSTLPIS